MKKLESLFFSRTSGLCILNWVFYRSLQCTVSNKHDKFRLAFLFFYMVIAGSCLAIEFLRTLNFWKQTDVCLLHVCSKKKAGRNNRLMHE